MTEQTFFEKNRKKIAIISAIAIVITTIAVTLGVIAYKSEDSLSSISKIADQASQAVKNAGMSVTALIAVIVATLTLISFIALAAVYIVGGKKQKASCVVDKDKNVIISYDKESDLSAIESDFAKIMEESIKDQDVLVLNLKVQDEKLLNAELSRMNTLFNKMNNWDAINCNKTAGEKKDNTTKVVDNKDTKEDKSKAPIITTSEPSKEPESAVPVTSEKPEIFTTADTVVSESGEDDKIKTEIEEKPRSDKLIIIQFQNQHFRINEKNHKNDNLFADANKTEGEFKDESSKLNNLNIEFREMNKTSSQKLHDSVNNIPKKVKGFFSFKSSEEKTKTNEKT